MTLKASSIFGFLLFYSVTVNRLQPEEVSSTFLPTNTCLPEICAEMSAQSSVSSDHDILPVSFTSKETQPVYAFTLSGMLTSPLTKVHVTHMSSPTIETSSVHVSVSSTLIDFMTPIFSSATTSVILSSKSSTPIISRIIPILPESSGDFGQGDISFAEEPSPETTQMSRTPTATPTSQLTTSIFASSSVSIPSLVTSTPIPSFFFSPTLTPSESSTPIFFTPTPTAVSSIITTMAPVLSTAIPTTTILPNPTPTLIPATLPATPDPILLPPCETPLAPIQVDIDGLGFVLDESVTHVESDKDSLKYTVMFGEFIGQSGQLSRSGDLNAMFDGFNGQSTMYNLDADSIASLTGFITNEEVWSDNPHVSVAFQVRDSSFNSNIDAYCEVILTNLRERTMMNRTNCQITAPCGTSTALLNIPEEWFMETRTSIIDITIMVEERMFELGSVTLMPTGPTQIDNTAFMVPPKHTLLPGEEFRVPIYASFDRRLAGFSLDCQILGTAAELRGAESNFTWSLLPRSHPSDNNRISLTGFRNYDRTNTNQINFTESLANLIIAIHPENQAYESIHVVEIQCETFKLVLTNGTDLAKKDSITYVKSLNRDGEISMRGRVHIETRNYAGIFACANQNEIINTARLTMEVDKINMSVYGFNIISSELDRLSINGLCSSEDENIIKVDMYCMYVYFDGSEMYGAEEIRINVIPSSLEANGSIPFRVWLPSQQINISLADSTLNAIETVATCENGSTLYQRSSFAIMTTISTDTDTTTIYVTSLLRPYLNVSDKNIARLTEDRYFIEGIDIGIAMIYVSTLNEINGTEIIVTNDIVTAECLDIFAFSSINVEIPDEMIDMDTATITLQQEFDFIGSNLNIVPVVLFSDDSRMLLTEKFKGLGITITPEMNNVLEQSTPSSISSYNITGLIDDFNISISWELESLQECEIIIFISYNSYMNSEDTETPTVIVNATSNYLTASDDAAIYFRTPDFVLLEVYLSYNDVFVSNITSHDNVMFKVHEDSQHLVRLVNHLGQMRRVETNGTKGGNATIKVTFVPLNLTTAYVIIVKRTVSFILTAYREADNRATFQLNQIGTSGVYQHARLSAAIGFTDGVVEKVSNDNLMVDVVSNNSGIVMINMEEVNVSYTGSGFENISLQATLVESNIQSDILDIIIDSDPVVVSSITNITLSSMSAEVNEPVFADCTALLTDGTILTTTFDHGRPLYPGLITFSTTDQDILSLEQSYGIVRLLKNSLTNVSLTASATENVTHARNFSVSLNPSPGEIGLKTMATEVETGNMFEVSVILNSVQEAVGVYELELAYESIPGLEIVNIMQGDNWRNGTVISAMKSRGVITIGGVLNTGAESILAELAVVTFRAEQEGKLSFNASINYTANTNVIPNIINVQNSSLSPLSGQIEVQILSQISKREAQSSYDYDYYEWLPYEYTSPSKLRSKRATCNFIPTAIDINGDCDTDLWDVYVLQEFLASEVYNFSTSQGEQLTQRGVTVANIGEQSISQIFIIEQNSLDFTFNVSGVFYTFFLQNNSAPCTFLVIGTLYTALEFVDIVNIVQIYLDFSHNTTSFQDEFNSTFSENVIARKNGVNGQYGGTIMAELSSEGRDVLFTALAANSAFKTEAFTLDVLLSVQVDAAIQLSSSVDISSLSIQRVFATIVSGAVESCIPTTEAPTTTEVLTTTEAPTIMATTQISTTTEITTTMATTQFPTTITITVMATPQLTTVATTEVATTTTNVVTTKVSTAVTITVTSTVITTSQISTPIITTEFPTIVATSESIATTEAPLITATPTIVATPTIIATTEAVTSMAISTSALTTMVTQTTMVSTAALTTVATTEPPIIMTSSAALMVTTSTIFPTPIVELITTTGITRASSIEASITTISSTVSANTTSIASTSMINTAAPVTMTSVVAPETMTSIEAPISTTGPVTTTTSVAPMTTVITIASSTTDIVAPSSTTTTTNIMAPVTTTSIVPSVTVAATTAGPMTSTAALTSTMSPTLMTSSPEPPATMASDDEPTTGSVDEPAPTGDSSLIVAIGVNLGLIAGILAIITIIFVAVYLVKKYRKMGGYSPRSDLTTPSRQNKGYVFKEEEGVEFVGDHIYDLPLIDNPPPLPPRKVTVMNKSILESSKKVISNNEAESTFIGDNHGQDSCHDYSESDENHKVQLGLSSQLQVVGDTIAEIPLQKNEAYGLGLVLENVQTPPPTAILVSEPVASTSSTTTSDPQTTDSASKYKQISTYNGPQLHTAEQLDLCTAVENTHVDHESDSEHKSYEQVCSYEKVQPCDIEHLLVQISKEERCHQDPSLQSKALKKDSKLNDDSVGTAGSDKETGASPAESLNSYERVWGYERIHHCDLPLEEFIMQKDDRIAASQ